MLGTETDDTFIHGWLLGAAAVDSGCMKSICSSNNWERTDSSERESRVSAGADRSITADYNPHWTTTSKLRNCFHY